MKQSPKKKLTLKVLPTEDDFRHCGYTIAALEFPLSEMAVRGLAHKNGLSFEQYFNISPAVWYAPNRAEQLRAEKHGQAHAEGRLHKDEEGRWSVTIESSRRDGRA